jgi:DNA-binding Lrp family transcriptional regulator
MKRPSGRPLEPICNDGFEHREIPRLDASVTPRSPSSGAGLEPVESFRARSRYLLSKRVGFRTSGAVRLRIPRGFVPRQRGTIRWHVSGEKTGSAAGISSKTHTAYVDDLDLSILRWMYPGGLFSFWGADPRITPSEIASHVGLDRTAVWDRLRKWRREGFWNGFEVDLNLGTLGLGEFRVEIKVADSPEGWALLDKLEQIDGILWARVGFGDTITQRDVEVVSVRLVADTPEHIVRRMQRLRELSPTGIVDGPFRNEAPSCSRDLTPLDWRIIAAAVANPNASTSRLASLVGVTVKTFVHHHSALIDGHAVFYIPQVDWSRMGCACLGVFCQDIGDFDPVRRAFEVRFPHSIPLAPLREFGGITAGWDDSTCFGIIVPAHSPHEVQTLLRDVSMIPGVRKARPEYWGPERRYSKWVRLIIAEKLANPLVVTPRPEPRSGGRKSPELAYLPLGKEAESAIH